MAPRPSRGSHLDEIHPSLPVGLHDEHRQVDVWLLHTLLRWCWGMERQRRERVGGGTRVRLRVVSGYIRVHMFWSYLSYLDMFTLYACSYLVEHA